MALIAYDHDGIAVSSPHQNCVGVSNLWMLDDQIPHIGHVTRGRRILTIINDKLFVSDAEPAGR